MDGVLHGFGGRRRPERPGWSKALVAEASAQGAGDGPRVVIAQRGFDGDVGARGVGQGQRRLDAGFSMVTAPVTVRKTSFQMPVSRPRMVGIQSQPMVAW